MSQPSEEEEAVKEIVASEQRGTVTHETAFDDPENDGAKGSWGLWLLAAFPIAIVAYVLYLVFS